MASSDVVYRPLNFGPSPDLGNATTETLFLNKVGTPVTLPLQNDGQWNNSRLAVHLGGRVQTTVNVAFSLGVYFSSTKSFGTAPAISGSTLIFTTNYVTINALKTNWQVDLQIFWDNDAKIICGNTLGQMGDTILGQNTLIATPVANPSLHIESNSFQNVFYGLTVSGQFNTSSTGNHAYVDVFSLELL